MCSNDACVVDDIRCLVLLNANNVKLGPFIVILYFSEEFFQKPAFSIYNRHGEEGDTERSNCEADSGSRQSQPKPSCRSSFRQQRSQKHGFLQGMILCSHSVKTSSSSPYRNSMRAQHMWKLAHPYQFA